MQIRVEIERRVGDCLARLRQAGIRIPPVTLRFDLRGTAAGRAIVGGDRTPTIRLNPVLMAENGVAFLDQTIPHEVAHLGVYYWLGHQPRRPHGPEWRRLMQLLGAEPARCHNFDVGNCRVRRLTTHRYTCACREHRLTSIRHNRARRGVCYHCQACGSALQELGDEIS